MKRLSTNETIGLLVTGMLDMGLSIKDACDVATEAYRHMKGVPVAKAKYAGPVPPGLSWRQARILELKSQGLSRREIALEAGIKNKTVSAHIWQIRHSLGIKTTDELMAWYGEQVKA